jgi:hypothetical protein
VKIYKQQGFKVTHILLDGEFEPLRGDLAALEIQLNLVSNAEHVPEVEQYIRTLKDQTRCIYNTLPFKHMPPRVIIEMVQTSNFWLNAFPYPDGVSKTLSPRTIVTGSALNYNLHCALGFGTYVQTHEAHDNTMATRTTGALALRPTGNAQGGFRFYSLTTGRVITQNRWTELPMPNEVIHCVGHLARRANAASGGLAFQNRFGIPIPDNIAGEENGHVDFLEDSTDDDGSYILADDNSDHSNDDELNTDIGDNDSNEFDDGNIEVDVDENQDINFD